ncbi:MULTISPECIES: hypothetical protein [Thioalkalivibrio]|uniref:Uncharacterized protein n=1 Tax=Thioalkalivibrio halophilus TaxID=252474 RepID=A0A1V3A0T7_9GAMM|nr:MULTISPECIES: hypothetical protein [Thioalkalivibrio]OOC10962.1 hypothetical protein B1A74_02155 [Thioalkalivibrio halophilus]PYG02582.1 hypothetical protein D893_01500 [Thioalkalivibrio sp. ALE21]
MNVDMGDEGLDVTGISREQCATLVEALKASSDQSFMEDPELRKLFKLLAVLQSDLWDEMTAGQFDFSQYKKQ